MARDFIFVVVFVSDPIPFKKLEHTVNEEAVRTIESLLGRLKTGEATATAFVEVQRAGLVSTQFINSVEGTFHRLNSGCAILAARIANTERMIKNDFLDF